MSSGHITKSGWNQERPHSLVIACSDGRLQENLDDFLHRGLGITHYDRLYAPGGGGALAASGSSLMRPEQFRRECRFLLQAHFIEDLYVIFHGPAADGPDEAVCGDYVRKMPGATAQQLRAQQDKDATILKRLDWGTDVALHTYRCEVRGDHRIQFVEI